MEQRVWRCSHGRVVLKIGKGQKGCPRQSLIVSYQKSALHHLLIFHKERKDRCMGSMKWSGRVKGSINMVGQKIILIERCCTMVTINYNHFDSSDFRKSIWIIVGSSFYVVVAYIRVRIERTTCCGVSRKLLSCAQERSPVIWLCFCNNHLKKMHSNLLLNIYLLK